MPVLEVCDLERTFDGRPPVRALRGVTFCADEGETVGLLGANGAGKTTVVKIIATLLVPTRGAVRILGHDVVRHPRAARSDLSVVFGGDRGLYNRLTALDNLLFLGGLHGIRKGLRRRALDALAAVGLAERAGSRVETFSKGMRQRLHLAAGLFVTPRLLVLDEPTVGLDVFEAQRIRDMVRQAARSGLTVLLTSHNPVDIDQLADRVVVLESGAVSHNLPVADFRRLAGFVAEVVVQGTGPPPLVGAATGNAAAVVRSDGTAGGWTVTERVRAWSPEVLDGLARIIASTEVDDVRVAPAGVEAVLHALYRRG